MYTEEQVGKIVYDLGKKSGFKLGVAIVACLTIGFICGVIYTKKSDNNIEKLKEIENG